MTDHPDRPVSDGRIVDSAPYGQHIPLTCENHPELRWHTKNISPIGARSIFFAGTTEVDPETGERKQAYMGPWLDWKDELKAYLDDVNPYARHMYGFEQPLEGDTPRMNSLDDVQEWIDGRRAIEERFVVECKCPVSDLIPLAWLGEEVT